MLASSQSAYRQFHGTETAVLKVYNDVLLAEMPKLQASNLVDLLTRSASANQKTEIYP